MARRRLRWRGAVAAVLVLAAAGIWLGDGTLMLSAAIPLAYLAYGSLSTAVVPEDLVATRRVDPSLAPPGRPVTIELTVTNESDRTLDDLRLVDRVPEELAVLQGSPRAGATLAPGESVTVEYSVVARRGEYDFAAPRLRVRDTGAGTVTTTEPTVDGANRVVCRLDADAPPLADRGSDRVGQLTADEPGEGLSFHSTREYRRGDPATRIDWRQYAKRGHLATVNYERWVSTTVVLVLDAREPARVAAGPGRPSAVELGAYAATRALASLLGSGHDVAVAVVGVDGDGPSGLSWLPPGGGGEQRSRAIDLLGDALGDGSGDPTTDEASNAGAAGADAAVPNGSGGRTPDDGATDRSHDAERQFRKVVELAGPGSQLVLVSPMLDQVPVDAAESWAAFDYPRIVLSPDVISANTVSGQYEQVRRRTRLARCQATGARTIDWRRGTPLPVVLSYAFTVAAREPGVAAGRGGGA